MNADIAHLLAQCEQEKLHLSGAIQGFGALAVLDEQLVITQASENLGALFAAPVQEILGQPLAQFTGDALDPRGGFATELDKRRMVLGIRVPDDSLQDALVSRHKSGFVVEFQPALPLQQTQFQFNHHLSSVMRLTLETNDIQIIMDKVNAIMAETTGFDKSMIYQFQEDWSGEVVAEKDESGHFPLYDGLRFPASDIPKIARDLYAKLPYRLIYDASADAVPVVAKPGDRVIPDLTYADLRSVSPVHVEYLANMAVGCSFSLPILVGGELWGLFALHNREPKYLSIEQRYLCAEIAHSFSLTLMTLNTQNRIKVLDQLDRQIARIIDRIDIKTGTPGDLLSVEDELLDLIPANGGAMVDGEKVVTFGETPDQDVVRQIDRWYRDIEDDQTVFSTECLSDLMPGSFGWKDHISGILVTQSLFKGASSKLYIYWFRPELPSEVNWAGNPEKRVVQSEGGDIKISPRESFARWTEITEARSKVWTHADKAAAAKFRAMVLKAVLR